MAKTKRDLKLKLIQGQSQDDHSGSPDLSPESEERREFVDYLFERYHHSLLRYLRQLTANTHDAEEVLQEAFIRIMRVETLDTLEARARGYLFKIATNIIRDRKRKEASQFYSAHLSIDDIELENQSPVPEKLFEWQEGLRSIKRCLMELSPRCQKVFVLHCIESLSYKEISKILNVSTKTVERDMLMAIELCQEKVGPWE